MNAPPDVKIQIGHNVESFYEPDSDQVKALNKMFTRLAEIAFGLVVLSLPFLAYYDGSGPNDSGIKTGRGLIKKLIKEEDAKEKDEFNCN